jgi:hypothetical protein
VVRPLPFPHPKRGLPVARTEPALFPGVGLYRQWWTGNGVGGLSSGEVLLGGVGCQGWWLVVEEESGRGRVVAGPFADRAEAAWLAAWHPGTPSEARPVFGVRRPSGVLERRPSAEDWAWLGHVGEQLERLPEGWDAELPGDDEQLTTLLVELAAALVESGLPLHDEAGPARDTGGVSLRPLPEVGGVVVAWRQHDRMSVEQVHGPGVDAAVQEVLNRALADVLLVRGFDVRPFGDGSASVVHPA